MTMTEPMPPLPPTENVVLLSPAAPVHAMPGDAQAFTSWEPFEASAVAPLAFYLEGWDHDASIALCQRIRHSAWWDRPIVVASTSTHLPATADAQGDPDLARTLGERALAVRRSLRLNPGDMRLDERLLYFLYLRDNAELQPVCERTHVSLYHYPMADALAHPEDDVAATLATLTRRKLLDPGTLIDRTRHCRACGCAHIHYVDVCPHCASLQIRKAPSLHCFSCGHVGPESDFLRNGALSCPQCYTALRHIGVDYDRPLTQYACASCHHVFVETVVQARCLECATTCAPNELAMREVATLRLSPHGRAALRAGQIHETFAALDTANYVEPPHFRRMLDWALATSARHQEMHFGLMLIEFQNATELIEQQGASRVFLLLDEFARRLHELLRTSDISTRTQEEKLWLFLPFSASEGLALRLQKALAEQSPVEGGAPLRARIRHLQIPGPGGKQAELDADRLMAQLEAQP